MNGIDRQQINGFIVKAFAAGPDRVVTHTEGYEVKHTTSREHASQMEIYPDVIFVREDGWTLGATYGMAIAARRLWQGRWVACLDLRSSQGLFIEEGKKK